MPEIWVALLGKCDHPTDGVEDYCRFLAGGLATHNVELGIQRVTWDETGWLKSLLKLWRDSGRWQAKWVLFQYTAVGWSRRGFPLGSVLAMAILRVRRISTAVVFHEFMRQSTSSRVFHRLRGCYQESVIQILNRLAKRSVFTAPVESISWLNGKDSRSAFIPIGANVPERLMSRNTREHKNKTVVIFGVTEAPNMDREAKAIIKILLDAQKSTPPLRLLLLGRGSLDAENLVAPILKRAGVDVIAKGVLPAAEIADNLASADALLFVRGPLTLRRGSALAGIACGLPVVGYSCGRIENPLDRAGVGWADLDDTTELSKVLVRVLTDESLWTNLHERNLQIQKEYFRWSTIARRFLSVLPS